MGGRSARGGLPGANLVYYLHVHIMSSQFTSDTIAWFPLPFKGVGLSSSGHSRGQGLAVVAIQGGSSGHSRG